VAGQQRPAILAYLERTVLNLASNEVVNIGTWQGRASHPLRFRLSPLHVRLTGDPKRPLEQFWPGEKCLAVWDRNG
jgi:hypothetical protein